MSDKVWKFSENDVDLSEFANNEEYSDVTIQVGSENIPCHLIILVNRIPFFRTLFASSSKKSIESEIFELKVVTAEAFHEILKYAYSGTFEISEQNVVELLRASCFLDVEKIMEKCVEYVNSTNLGERAILDLFLVAFQHNLESIKEKSRNYILSEIAVASNNERFTDLTFAHMKYLFDKRVGLANVQTEYLLNAILKWIEKDADGMKMKLVPSLLLLLDLTIEEIRSFCEEKEKYKKLFGEIISHFAAKKLIPEMRFAIKSHFYLTAYRYDNFNNLTIEFHFGIFRKDDIVLTGEKRILPAAARFEGGPDPKRVCYSDGNVFCVTRVNPTVIEKYADCVTKFYFPHYATLATYESRAKRDCVYFVQYKTYEGTINYDEAILRYYNIRTSEWWVTRVLPEVAMHYLFPFLMEYDDLFILTESDENEPNGRIEIDDIYRPNWYHPRTAIDSACYLNGKIFVFMRRTPIEPPGNYRLFSYSYVTDNWHFENMTEFTSASPTEILCAFHGNYIYAFAKVDTVGPCFVSRFEPRLGSMADHTALDSIPLSVRDVRMMRYFPCYA